jgi:hypothetical protein
MNTEKIRKEIRTSIRKRMPLTFEGLYEETFSHLTGVYWWYDRNILRQYIVIELLETFPKRLSFADRARLTAIWRDADRAREKTKLDNLTLVL